MSLLIGGGTFAAGRTGHELMNGLSGPKPNKREDQLELDVPHQTPGLKQANDDDFQMNLNRAILAAVGLPAGFLGTKGLYDHLKGGQMDNRRDMEKQKYLQQLGGMGAFKQANDGASPTTDTFIAKFAEELEKGAFEGINFEGLPEEVQHRAFQNGFSQDIGSRALGAASGGISDNGIAAAKMLAITTALLSGGAMLHADQKKRDAEKKQVYPTSVRTNPVNIPAGNPPQAMA